MSIRIGLHFGSPITAGGAAQRVAMLAGSGQIFTTGETLESLSPQQRETIRKLELPSRAKAQTVTVYEVIWHTSPSPRRRAEDRVNCPCERRGAAAGDLSRPRTVVDTKITIGRRPGHGIELNDPSASRDHAYIERRTTSSCWWTTVRTELSLVRRAKGNRDFITANWCCTTAGPFVRISRRPQAPEIVRFRCDPPNAIGDPPKRH